MDDEEDISEEERAKRWEASQEYSRRGLALERKYTKAQLLAMAFKGGLVNYNQPAKWRKDELVSTVLEQQYRAEGKKTPWQS